MITRGDQRLPIKSKTFLITVYSKELNEVFVINFHFSFWNDFAVRKRGGGRDTEQAENHVSFLYELKELVNQDNTSEAFVSKGLKLLYFLVFDHKDSNTESIQFWTFS